MYEEMSGKVITTINLSITQNKTANRPATKLNLIKGGLINFVSFVII